MRRLGEWATIEKLGTVAEVLFKITALVAALAAANFFFFRPEVELDTRVQPFIDLTVLRASYAAENESLPIVIVELADEYNRRNSADLRRGRNSTRTEISGTELCGRMPQLVEQVFRDADCSQSEVELGRGRYYERLLLARNATQRRPLDGAGLRGTLRRLASADYLKARTRTTNIGNAKAANVRIRVSEGFQRPGNQANDPFSLSPEESFDVDFETTRGGLEDPRIQFGVDWEHAALTNSGLVVWVASALLLAFVLVLINDFVRSPRGRGE